MVQIAGSMPTDAGGQKFVVPVDPASGVPKIGRAKAISGDYSAAEVVVSFDDGNAAFVYNHVGYVAAAPRGDVVFISNVAYAVEFAPVEVSTSGDQTIVAARASLRILVLSYDLLAGGATTVRWKSGAGTNLTGPMPFAANGGKIAPFSPVGHFKTAVNTALILNLGGSIAVGGHIAFVAHP